MASTRPTTYTVVRRSQYNDGDDEFDGLDEEQLFGKVSASSSVVQVDDIELRSLQHKAAGVASPRKQSNGAGQRSLRIREVNKEAVQRRLTLRYTVIGLIVVVILIAVIVAAVKAPQAWEQGPTVGLTSSSFSSSSSSSTTVGTGSSTDAGGAVSPSPSPVQQQQQQQRQGGGKFLHFSDFHLDLLYRSDFGSACFCNDPFLSNSTISQSTTATTVANVSTAATAGAATTSGGVPPAVDAAADRCRLSDPDEILRLGRHGCDSSEMLINRTLARAREVLAQPDFILVTGDYVRHDTDNILDGGEQRVALILRTIERVAELIDAFFPTTSTHHAVEPYYEPVVVNALGNNDLDGDYNLLVPASETESPWLVRVAPAFFRSLESNQSVTFRLGGYYVQEVLPGLHVISLNTVVYSPHHRPSNVTLTDPFGQFAWLQATLANLDVNSSTVGVYIVGHIPPTIDQYSFALQWEERFADQYFGIVRRFRQLVLGQLFGHVHCNTFRVLQLPAINGSTDGPVDAPVFVTTAITPVYQNNPGFRVWEFDSMEAAAAGGEDQTTTPRAADREEPQFHPGTLRNFTVYALSLVDDSDGDGVASDSGRVVSTVSAATGVVPGSANRGDLVATISQMLSNTTLWESYVDQLLSLIHI